VFNEPFSLYRRSEFQRNKSFYLTITSMLHHRVTMEYFCANSYLLLNFIAHIMLVLSYRIISYWLPASL